MSFACGPPVSSSGGGASGKRDVDAVRVSSGAVDGKVAAHPGTAVELGAADTHAFGVGKVAAQDAHLRVDDVRLVVLDVGPEHGDVGGDARPRLGLHAGLDVVRVLGLDRCHLQRRPAKRVERLLASGAFPVVLGGDCSILLGCLLGDAAERAVPGLLLPRRPCRLLPARGGAERRGRVHGAGARHWPRARHRRRSRRPAPAGPRRGRRGARPARRGGGAGPWQPADRGQRHRRARPRRASAAGDAGCAAAAEALRRLADPALDGFWVHLDADVLDDAIMPAVDYRMPDGLRFDELGAVAAGRHRVGPRASASTSRSSIPGSIPTERHSQALRASDLRWTDRRPSGVRIDRGPWTSGARG